MTLCRLLFRSFRRYSSSSTPYPFHSHFPTSTSNTPTPTNDNSYTNSQYPNPDHYNPQSSPPPPAGPYNPQYHPTYNHYNPHPPAAAAPDYQYSPNHQYNTQFPAAGDHNPQFSTSNHHYNPQIPTSGDYNPQFPPINSHSTASPADPSNNLYNSPIPSASTQNQNFNFQSSISNPQRSYGFSSAEEAAAERRRRKRRLRIEPPLYALRSNPPPQTDAYNPDKPRLPDSTSALVGNRLNLHNRVQSLIRAGDLDSASYIARQSVFQSVRPTVFTCNAIIAAMYRAKRYSDAKALFQYFFRQYNIIPNIVSYNNLIVSHCESNEIDDALKVYESILENAPYSPSAVTYRHLTKGLIDAGRLDEAVSLLREMLNKGHGADSLVFNNVILGFLNLGKLDKANELFDELKERCTVYDGVVNATFMDWFFNQGKPKEAMESYRDLMSRNYRMVPATQNVLLETLLRHGKKKEAWDLFHYMLDDHTPPTFQAVNSDTVNMMVNECFKEGKVEEAMEVFKRSGKGLKSKPFQMDVGGFNNMMARLCELDMLEEAEQYYKQLCVKSLSPDVNTYRTLIDAYIKADRVDNMLEKYSKMVEVGLRVIPPYANKWFRFLIEKGKVFDCLPILSKMADREPKPDVTTYDIVLKGLVEEGNYDAIINLLREMMNHGIGTTPSLKELVLDVFEKQGRRVEIENILNTIPSPHRPYQVSQGQPRMAKQPEMAGQGVRNLGMQWQAGFASQASYANQYTEHTCQSQMTEQIAHTHPMSGQEAEFPRKAEQNAANM
ncbi:hypothetical protein ACJIZ3_015820 [Penstemon smallii]|uniref:Pentatricopeptide repeat-containing protein n=1 Tax=Penstemon smallii TaxID=265156 RepID=A0ABD3RQY0_9LAMI